VNFSGAVVFSPLLGIATMLKARLNGGLAIISEIIFKKNEEKFDFLI